MSGEVNVIPTLREIRGGASPSKFGGGQSRDIFRGGPVKKITLYIMIPLMTSVMTMTMIISAKITATFCNDDDRQ